MVFPYRSTIYCGSALSQEASGKTLGKISEFSRLGKPVFPRNKRRFHKRNLRIFYSLILYDGALSFLCSRTRVLRLMSVMRSTCVYELPCSRDGLTPFRRCTSKSIQLLQELRQLYIFVLPHIDNQCKRLSRNTIIHHLTNQGEGTPSPKRPGAMPGQAAP